MTSLLISVHAFLGAATVSAALLIGLVPGSAHAAPASAHGSAVVVHTVTVVPVLKRGSRGPYVTTVQKILGVKPTGYFGLRTQAAVTRFQATLKLPATGVVGPTTWAALKRRAVAASRASIVAASAAVSDPTMTTAASTLRTARNAIPLAVWMTSEHGRMIVKRESGGSCSITSPGGTYRGKWQMSSTLWAAYGGTAYATTADRATCAQQDQVAYRIWLASWWRPWGG